MAMGRQRSRTRRPMEQTGRATASGNSNHGKDSRGAQLLGDKGAGKGKTGSHGAGGSRHLLPRATSATHPRGVDGPATDCGRRHWRAGTRTRMFRSGKLSKQLDWDLQSRFEHVDEKVLAGPGYLQAIFGILDGIAGEKDVSEKRRVVRAALFEGQRKRDETLSQFAVRREQEFAGADRYLTIPSELKAFILEETAALSRQGVQNLRTLTGGAADFDKMVGALKTLDVEEEPLTRGKGSFLTGAAQSEDGDEADGQDDEGSEASLEDTERVEAFLAEVSGVEEGVALEMLAAFEKETGNQPPRRRTWKQNKDRKLAAKKDRRVFSRPRVSMSDLKERTRCANCGERGHWQAECKRPYRSKEERARAENRGDDKGKRAVSFVYLGFPENGSSENTFVGWLSGGEGPGDHDPGDPIHRKDHGQLEDSAEEVAPDLKRPGETHKDIRDDFFEYRACGQGGGSWWRGLVLAMALNVFFAVAPGHAILDIGAGQDLIGEPAFKKLCGRLRDQGLRCLRLAEAPPAAHGVGGQASPLYQALVPCMLAGIPGVIKVTVIREDIPHLLSVGLLEATGAVIDMQRNAIDYKELGTSEAMIRMRSGHRVVDIASWKTGDSFPVPPHLSSEFGLTEGAFNQGVKLTGSAVEACMVQGGPETPTRACDQFLSSFVCAVVWSCRAGEPEREPTRACDHLLSCTAFCSRWE